MRVFSFFLFWVMECCYCIAQKDVYSPFVEEGKIWYMKYNNEEAPEYSDYDYCYYIQGDTVIGDIECKKFYVFNYNNTHETDYLLAIFENNRKVYFIPNNRDNSYVLYDFSITNGDIISMTDAIHIEWERNLINVEERTLNIKGESRRCIHVRPIWEEDPVHTSLGWWIEGIGSELGPLNTWLFGAIGNNRYFQKCVVNKKVLFDMEDFKDLITDIQPVSHIERNCPSDIFSLSGIKTKNRSGIYIQDKRKVLKH